MTGFDSKRQMAADKLHWSDCAVHNGPAYPTGECDCGVAQEPVLLLEARRIADEYGTPGSQVDSGNLYFALRKCLDHIDAQPAQEPDALTIVYQSGYHDGKQAALAGREWNFCERCGKRTADLTVIHTCTPPQDVA